MSIVAGGHSGSDGGAAVEARDADDPRGEEGHLLDLASLRQRLDECLRCDTLKSLRSDLDLVRLVACLLATVWIEVDGCL